MCMVTYTRGGESLSTYYNNFNSKKKFTRYQHTYHVYIIWFHTSSNNMLSCVIKKYKWSGALPCQDREYALSDGYTTTDVSKDLC